MITYKVNPSPCMGFGYPTFTPFGLGYAPANNVPKDTVLEYTLDKLDHALYFKVHFQHPAATAILKQGKYQAKNGMIIDISERPELRDSMNTIYLRGSDSKYDTRGDVTTFTHNFKRDNRYTLVRDAIKEFANFVRKNAPMSVYSLRSLPTNTICLSW
ncbi:hypothetical protein E4G67_01035 [Candidatus Bathyarchaeota archaeon]|nr:MAG: hypothetical protein E4G67_01035 [Candidatus Bathyarchaeota archaeon]